MQSFLSHKSFVCCNCLKRLNVLKTFKVNVSTKTPTEATETQPTNVKKSKAKLQLKVKQFPRLLKDIDKYGKKLAPVESSAQTNIKKSSDIVSHYVQTEANEEFIEETDGNAFKELVEFSADKGLIDYNVMNPEVDDIYEEIIEKPEDNVFSSDETNVKTKAQTRRKLSAKMLKKQEELRQKLKELEIQSKTLGLRHSLKSYIHACIYSDMVSKAHSVLIYYRKKNFRSSKDVKVDNIDDNPIDVSVYNALLRGWAQKGKVFRIKELFYLMKSGNVKPNSESYVYYFLALAKQEHPPADDDIMSIMKELMANDINLKHLFRNCYLSLSEKQMVQRFLSKSFPLIKCEEIQFAESYCSKLMESIEETEQKPYNPCEGLDLKNLDSFAKQQFALEINGNVVIKSIISDDLSNISDKTKSFLKSQWKKAENEWKSNLKDAFLRHIKILKTQSNEIHGMTLYPYLTVLDPQYYIDAILEEVRSRANMSEYYSPPVSTLYCGLGRRLMLRYLVKTHIRDGTAHDFQQLYDKFIDYYRSPELMSRFNPRQYWQKLMSDTQHHYNDDSLHKVWPYHVQVGVGQFLYNLMIQEVKIDPHIMRATNAAKRQPVPAFGIVYKWIGNLKYQKEFKVYPTLAKLFRKACLDSLVFDINMLPMICPPTPWISPKFGGYLLTKTEFVRIPDSYQKWVYSSYDTQSLLPVFDSLNYLSMCAWIVNTKVLDVAIHFFKNKGNQTLSIPKPLSEFPPLPKIDQSLAKVDKIQAYRRRNQQKREMAETYSLWCDCLYKLSIANNLRNKVFWFPNNLDFRGRVYPVPPHFNHLGGDLTRSLHLFAKGQPLGERGLDWLKIHLINLTGLKKRSSVAERLAFAEEILPLIIDSAENPLTGCKWWMESDEPWQTLSCAIEIANAVRSPDPTRFISHFPVHQDGSCNGLQHYAALGRDQSGAESVNLHPADRPQDVYSDVAALVEKQRAKDALEGHEIAKLLEGYVGRKTVKQTVMTYVYGVTRFGAKLQIFKRLKESETFPKERAFSAAIYLTQKTFLSIQEMFTETRAIQDWLTESARVISKVYEKPVEWVTPLGFPVIQPYHKQKAKVGETFMGIANETSIRYLSYSDQFQKPNIMKQKNAFPPNFIHSLDSTHMMLTSLQCHKEGLTFASVHDCFWTHPNCVEAMNRICRQQFVALHSEPILDDLSKHFIQIYGSMNSSANKNDINRAVSLLNKRLTKGSFVLENVLNSIYFFS